MAVLGGTADVAFAAVRPPGHHAESDQLAGMSECAPVSSTTPKLPTNRGGLDSVGRGGLKKISRKKL